MKEYEKALETYEKGLTYAPDSTELKDGIRRCQQQIQRFMTGMATEDEIKERQAKAMADPDVRLCQPHQWHALEQRTLGWHPAQPIQSTVWSSKTKCMPCLHLLLTHEITQIILCTLFCHGFFSGGANEELL